MSFYRKITSLLQSSKTTVSFAEAEQALRWKQLQEDPGKFEYADDGFTYPFKDGPETIKWMEIERIVAYKGDRLPFDDICLDLFWKGRKCTITEETPGWYQFLKRLATVFPTIPDNGEGQIAQPPFATNYIVLYEREDRVLPESNNFYASFGDIPPLTIVNLFEEQGWSIRKAGLTEWELSNTWSELHLEPDNQGVLLNGQMALHPDNIAILDQLLDSLGPYQYEFYDAEKNLLLERKYP